MRYPTFLPTLTHFLLLLLSFSGVTSLSLNPFSSVLSQANLEAEIRVNGSGNTQQTTPREASSEDWIGKTGDTALRQVQFLASKVAESTAAAEGGYSKIVNRDDCKDVSGTGGLLYNNPKYNTQLAIGGPAKAAALLQPSLEISSNSKREEQVWAALANLELDSKFIFQGKSWNVAFFGFLLAD
jgi:hypothetical protein